MEKLFLREDVQIGYAEKEKTSCDGPIPRVALTTHQPAEYSWMSGNPTPLSKIEQNLLCTESST